MTLIELLSVACPAIGLIAGVMEGLHRGILWAFLYGLAGIAFGLAAFILIICVLASIGFILSKLGGPADSARMSTGAWPPAPKQPVDCEDSSTHAG